jgi:hypothetical protein
MDQPTPKVTHADVERVIRRDFLPDQFDSVMSVLAEYGGETWHRELHRLQLAVLKLAAGSLEGLRREIEAAKCDYRDVLSYAEFPAYMNKTFRISQLPADEQRKIIDADWRQYETWFKR